MEKLNLPPFYVGQKVQYVGADGPFHKNGDFTRVTELGQASCGCWHIGTSVSGIDYLAPFTAICPCCNKKTTEGINGFIAMNFRPIQE